LVRDTFLNEAMRPVSDRARWNPERRLLRETHAGTSRRCVLPREKGENGTGMADLVAVIEMVFPGSSKFTVFLTRRKTNDVRIEI
jgi:hypothetical protein